MVKAEDFVESHNLDSSLNLSSINLVITDNDGCLTDGGVFYGENGELLKRFNIKDGMGVERLRNIGVETLIISGENSPSLRKRAEKLKIKHMFLGIKDKVPVLDDFFSKNPNFSWERTAYLGDDVNDLPALKKVALWVSPKDAEAEVLKQCHLSTRRGGGQGAFRDLAEFVICSR